MDHCLLKIMRPLPMCIHDEVSQGINLNVNPAVFANEGRRKRRLAAVLRTGNEASEKKSLFTRSPPSKAEWAIASATRLSLLTQYVALVQRCDPHGSRRKILWVEATRSVSVSALAARSLRRDRLDPGFASISFPSAEAQLAP
jgi:hypothetical protein